MKRNNMRWRIFLAGVISLFAIVCTVYMAPRVTGGRQAKEALHQAQLRANAAKFEIPAPVPFCESGIEFAITDEDGKVESILTITPENIETMDNETFEKVILLSAIVHANPYLSRDDFFYIARRLLPQYCVDVESQ